MSKDKGVKNIKKAPADKTKAIKTLSSYKSEGKIVTPTTSKSDGKGGK
jgi:hypothetical protein